MSNVKANLFEIKDYVEKLASKQRVKSFYPQTISRNLSIPLELVVIELPKLVELGMIELKYEIRCDDEPHTIAIVEDYTEVLNTEKFCEICGDNIEISYSNVYPIYYIAEEYKEHVLKKKLISNL